MTSRDELEGVQESLITEGYIVPEERCRLARANRKIGRIEDAQVLLEAAFAARIDENLFDSSLYLEKGEILLQRGAADEAERCFRQALEIARRQGAKSFELEAATSLGRLLRDRGKRDQAREILAPVYDWFTEGFDTADLQQAKALLEELA